MQKFLSNSRYRAPLAVILCLPLIIGQLLGAAGVDQNALPAVFNSTAFAVVMLGLMLAGLWLFGAPPGLSALIGLLSTLPFAIMELVNRKEYGEQFPYMLFVGMWLMGTIFTATLIPVVRDLRSGAALQNRFTLALRLGILLLVAAGWLNLVADQMPCFLGVQYCD